MLPVSSFLGFRFIGEVIAAAQIFLCLPFWVENTDPPGLYLLALAEDEQGRFLVHAFLGKDMDDHVFPRSSLHAGLPTLSGN